MRFGRERLRSALQSLAKSDRLLAQQARAERTNALEYARRARRLQLLSCLGVVDRQHVERIHRAQLLHVVGVARDAHERLDRALRHDHPLARRVLRQLRQRARRRRLQLLHLTAQRTHEQRDRAVLADLLRVEVVELRRRVVDRQRVQRAHAEELPRGVVGAQHGDERREGAAGDDCGAEHAGLLAARLAGLEGDLDELADRLVLRRVGAVL
mmetsp:Transcript_18413/g.46114  ORF Transcript_18413/g.46114 Transcript_18413/m.46114 type:complete len:212 (+) Transcript_18413:480-1115(+)